MLPAPPTESMALPVLQAYQARPARQVHLVHQANPASQAASARLVVQGVQDTTLSTAHARKDMLHYQHITPTATVAQSEYLAETSVSHLGHLMSTVVPHQGR